MTDLFRRVFVKSIGAAALVPTTWVSSAAEVAATVSVRVRFAALLVASMIPATHADPTQPTEAKRTVLERHDQSGVAGKEIILGTAELPAGTVIGWHIHYGDESGYVLKGRLVLKVEGQPDRVLKPGDYFFNPAGLAHSLAAEPDTDGGTALSTWIVAKGKPLAEPVDH
jgi:quercetin dioxygenase-like cupin family protein